jgi:DGQHR domain-containing protein
MICACCGMEIVGKSYGPYHDDQYYCKRCWDDPSLFFADKPVTVLQDFLREGSNLTVENLNLIEVIDQYRKQSVNPKKGLLKIWEQILGKCFIEIPVIQAHQMNITLYFGKIKAYELLLLSSVDQWTESECTGYQRVQFKSKRKEIKDYLKMCPIPLVPAILGSINEGEFLSTNEHFGTLRFPVLPGAISLLDGQQRTGGFDELFYEFKGYLKKNPSNIKTDIIEKYFDLFNFELPIVFLDSADIAKKINLIETNSKHVEPLDVERAFFIIINKTQKAVNASLKDELAYKTIEAGIRGIPVIEKDMWRTEIIPIANYLNGENGPLNCLINLGGIPGLKKPIQLNGFVTSLKMLFISNDSFKELDAETKSKFLCAYWETIRDLFPDAFDRQHYDKYLLTKSIGIYSLNYLANDVFNQCISNELDPCDKQTIAGYLYPLKGFDWSVESSPFTYLAGKKGVKKAKEMMSELIRTHSHA